MTKGRNQDPKPDQAVDDTDLGAVASKAGALTVLASRASEVAELYGDGLIYDRARIVHEARFYMSQSAEAMLEAGKRLIQIKENEPQGEFIEIVTGQLGLEPRTAQLMMKAAVKYLSPALAANAKSISYLGKTKLLDLMAESDGDLAELAEGGTVAGLNLNDMQAMSSRELRAALVEARKTAAAKDAVIAKKDQKLNAMTEADERRRSASRDERHEAAMADLRDATLAVESAIELLLSRLDEVMTSPPTEACSLAARQTLDYVVQRLVGAAETRNLAIDLDGVVPGQMQAIRDAVVASRTAPKTGG